MYYIGVDLGGTNIAVGIVDENYQLVKKESVPTKPERGPDLIVKDMAKVSRKLLSELGINLSAARLSCRWQSPGRQWMNSFCHA